MAVPAAPGAALRGRLRRPAAEDRRRRGVGPPLAPAPAVIENATDTTINDVASTKQSVNSTTGIVVIAGEVKNSRYYHAEIKGR